MKKFLSSFLVVCIMLGCFVGCDESRSVSESDTQNAPTATAADGNKEENTLIKNEISGQESYSDKLDADGGSYDISDVVPLPTTAPVQSSAPETDNDYMYFGTPDIWSSPTVTSAPVATMSPLIKPTMRPDYTTTPLIIPPPTSVSGGSVVKPDNPDLDCIAMDFRGGNDAFYDFSDGYYYIMTAIDSSHDCYLDPKDAKNGSYGYLNVAIEGSDPFFYMYDLGGKEYYPKTAVFNIQEYPIIKIVMKNNTSASNFDFFLFKQGYDCSDSERFSVSGISKNDTQFKTYYIDLRASGASNTLSVTKGSASISRDFSAVRFDVPGTSGAVGIQYIGFFKTLADAQAYK